MAPLRLKDRRLNLMNVGHLWNNVLGAPACSYELLARFNASDQGYSNAQVLDTAAEGVTAGSLTVVETDGAAQLTGNLCRLDSKTGDAWAELGLFSTSGITKALGTALFGKVEASATSRAYLAWNPSAAIGISGSTTYSHYPANQNWFKEGGASVAEAVIGTYVAGTQYETALVLGGYDSNGQPWYSGAAGTFLYGCSWFIKGGAYTDWTLLWRDVADNTATLYPAFALRDASEYLEVDDLRVPAYDYSSVLQPANVSLFTGTNGTSLDAYTPDVGGVWTEDAGGFDIQTNKANCDNVGSSPSFATASVSSGESDVFARTTINISSTYSSLILRLSDANNYWRLSAVASINNLYIQEVNGGVSTNRASTGVTINTATDYEITGIVSGQDLQCFLDGGDRLTYTSAFNQTATKHGIQSRNLGDTHDNFHVNSRTSSQYDRLNKCA